MATSRGASSAAAPTLRRICCRAIVVIRLDSGQITTIALHSLSTGRVGIHRAVDLDRASRSGRSPTAWVSDGDWRWRLALAAALAAIVVTEYVAWITDTQAGWGMTFGPELSLWAAVISVVLVARNHDDA